MLYQKRDATLDVAVSNIHGLIEDLKELRGRFPDIVRETSLVAEAIGVEPVFPSMRQVW